MSENSYAYNYLERKEMLPFVPESCHKILEVGCGDGSFSMHLQKKTGNEVWGIEMHAESAEKAAQRLFKVICGEFEEVMKDLPSRYFDCIVFNDALEHFSFPDKLLLKVKSLLKESGFVVTSLPNFRYVGNLWEIIIKKDFRYKNSGVLDYTHFRFFTQKSIIRMFNETGYKIIKSKGINGTKSTKVKLLNILTFNYFSDIYYMQIATLAQLD